MSKMTERLVVGGVALLVGLLLGWMVRGVTTYNTALATVATYTDWRTACPAAQAKDQPCEIVQDVQDERGQTLARVAITRNGTAQVIGFTMPFGVSLEPGLGLQFDKDPVRVFPYRTCNTVGCIVVAPFDDKLAASLSNASDVHVLVAGLDGKPVAIPLSLKGYPAAHRAYASTEAKRASWFWRMWS